MEEKTAGQPRSDEQLKKKLRRSERSVRDYQYFLLRLIILLLLLWVLFFKLIGVIRMPTGDMYPRIDAGDLVMFYRLDTNPSAQDVVALRRTVPLWIRYMPTLPASGCALASRSHASTEGGGATVSATTCGLAPEYVVETLTSVGATSG